MGVERKRILLQHLWKRRVEKICSIDWEQLYKEFEELQRQQIINGFQIVYR